MGNYRSASPSLLAALLVCGSALAATLTPVQVLSNSNQLNGQKISVDGIVSSPKVLISPDGKHYQSFKLCDAGTCLAVFTRDKSTYTEGKEITVKGHFWAVRHEMYITRYNELVLDDK